MGRILGAAQFLRMIGPAQFLRMGGIAVDEHWQNVIKRSPKRRGGSPQDESHK